MPDALIRLRRSTRRLAWLGAETKRVADTRGEDVAELQAAGWSLGNIAAALGVTKGAVAKMARRT